MTAAPLACVEFVEIVTEYLEGTMSAKDRRRFEEHLAACPGCTAYLKQIPRDHPSRRLGHRGGPVGARPRRSSRRIPRLELHLSVSRRVCLPSAVSWRGSDRGHAARSVGNTDVSFLGRIW